MPLDVAPEIASRVTGRGDANVSERWQDLFEAIDGGRRGAFEGLVDVASPRLFGLAVWITGSRDDAADVVAEVFVRVAERRGRLGAVRAPYAWMLTVARRLAVDVIRGRRRRPSEPLETAALVVAPAEDPDRVADARRASRLLAQLPPKQREVAYLRHFADCSFAEIGKVVGVPTFTAASRYRLAIRRLRRLMEVES